MEGTRRRGRADQALAVKHTWKPPEHGTPGHLDSQAVALKGQPGPGSLCGAAGWPRPGEAARCRWRGHARTPVFPTAATAGSARGPLATAGRARRDPCQLAGPRPAWAPRFSRRPQAGGRTRGGGEAPRPGTGLGSPAARAGRRRRCRRTKMSAGEKINPCLAAAALPLHSSPALSPSLLPRPRAAAAAAARAVLQF